MYYQGYRKGRVEKQINESLRPLAISGDGERGLHKKNNPPKTSAGEAPGEYPKAQTIEPHTTKHVQKPNDLALQKK